MVKSVKVTLTSEPNSWQEAILLDLYKRGLTLPPGPVKAKGARERGVWTVTVPAIKLDEVVQEP